MNELKGRLGAPQPSGYTYIYKQWAEWSFMTIMKYTSRTWVKTKCILEPCLNWQSSYPLSLPADGVVSFVLGKFPAKIGERPARSYVPKPYANVLSSYLDGLCKLGFNTNLSAVATGSFLTNLPYFKAMFEKVGCDSPPSNEEWKEIYRVFHKHVHLPALPRPLFRNVYSLEIKPDVFPGARSRYFLGLRKKITSLGNDLKVLRRVWFDVKKGNYFSDHIWTLGAREKREEMAVSGEVKTRGVLMCEGWYSLFEQVYSRGIEIFIHDLGKGSIYLGHSMCHWGWVRYFKDISNKGMVFEGDFKGFDTSIHEELMVRAFCLLRSCYPDSETVDKHFIYIMKNFIYKNILTPGGWLYRCNKGLPSGSPFTSLLGSVINQLVLIDILLHYPEFKKIEVNHDALKFCICGDDFVVGFPKRDKISEKIFKLVGERLDEAALSEWTLKRHGMKIKKPKLKYSDAAATDTLFGLCWREFHVHKKLEFPVPIFFFEGEESFVSSNSSSGIPFSVPNFEVPKVSKKLSRKQREKLIMDSLGYHMFEDEFSMVFDDLGRMNKALDTDLFSLFPERFDEATSKVFNYIGLTDNFWLFLRSYFVASDMCASFLKTIIWKGLPSVAFTDLYWRVFLPTSSCKRSWDPLNFLRSVYVCLPLMDYHTAWVMYYVIIHRFGFTLNAEQRLEQLRELCWVNNAHYFNTYLGTGGEKLLMKYKSGDKTFVRDAIKFSTSKKVAELKKVFSLSAQADVKYIGLRSFTSFEDHVLFKLYGRVKLFV